MRYTSNYYCICIMKLYALPVQDSLGGWRSFCYQLSFRPCYSFWRLWPVYGPLSELLESWQPWGAEHDICDLEVDSWIRWYLVSVPEDYPDTLTWHLWNMDKHNDNDGIKIKTKIIVSMHKYIKISCSYHRIHIPSHHMLPFSITIIIKFVCICWSWTRRRIHRNVDNTQ